jgi:hypothetical protein
MSPSRYPLLASVPITVRALEQMAIPFSEMTSVGENAESKDPTRVISKEGDSS